MIQQTKATGAEKAAWVVFGVALAIVLAAWAVYMAQLDTYGGEPEVPFAIMTAALPLVGLGLVPALILTGVRQLLAPRAWSVDDANATADDAHDGGGDTTGGEHLSGDVGKPDSGYTRSQR